jgi:predicted dehydrogenase
MSEVFRWGIIGTGGIAKRFTKDLMNTSNHRVVAVGSRTKEKAEEFAREVSASPFGSYEELVSADLDAVYIATPHSSHAENTVLALTAKKPVLVEKPFAVSANEARMMISASELNQVPLMEAMWSRFLPHYQLVRESIFAGDIGEIVAIYSDHGQALPSNPYYRLHAPELAGGALLDLGVYPISLTHMILGAPDEIIAAAEFTPSGVDANTSMIFTYINGAHALLNTTLLINTPTTATLIGTKGRVEIHGSFYSPTSIRITNAKGSRDYANEYKGHGLREQALAFEKIVRESKLESYLMTHEDSLQVMEIMDEVRNQIGLIYPFESAL